MSTASCIKHFPFLDGDGPEFIAGAKVAHMAPGLSAAELRHRTARLVHELRNPLHGVLGAASLMRFSEAGVGRPSPDRLLDIIEKSGQHMLTLISEIIEVALSPDGQPPIKPNRVDLRQLVADSLQVVEPLANRKRLLLSMTVQPSLPETVLVDALRIKQVLVNLLGNAIRFTDGGRVQLTVEASVGPIVTTESTRLKLSFAVEDSGMGMSEHDLAILLTCLAIEGQTPVRAVRRDGSGLGLQACQSLLRGMGSHLNISSVLGRGTRAWFTLLQ